ncbi:hypothetical protein [Marinobacterium iners]|nr:hypothetical protein [Marinobacterium iners]
MGTLQKPDYDQRYNKQSSRTAHAAQRDGRACAADPQVVVPATPAGQYISGIAALNIPRPEGTGDWHFARAFKPRSRKPRTFLMGDGCPEDTRPWLGEAGIEDVTAIVESMLVPHESPRTYAASHARAIADLVLVATKRNQPLDHIHIDDWMHTQDQKEQVYELLSYAKGKLESDQWRRLQEWKLSS